MGRIDHQGVQSPEEPPELSTTGPVQHVQFLSPPPVELSLSHDLGLGLEVGPQPTLPYDSDYVSPTSIDDGLDDYYATGAPMIGHFLSMFEDSEYSPNLYQHQHQQPSGSHSGPAERPVSFDVIQDILFDALC